MTDNKIAQPIRRARTRLGRRSILGVSAVAVALAAAACGSSSSGSSSSTTTAANSATKTSCASGTISGAGSTFVNTIASQWIKNYEGQCPGATINYSSVGSGAGVQQFTAGTVNFGASDVPFTSDQQTAANAKYPGGTRQIIWASGPISIEYNLPGVSNLKLDSSTLAGIFAGTIKTWNDQAIKSLNPGTSLPSSSIQVVHRSDGSGTTASFTGYLKQVAPSVWTLGSAVTVPWTTGQGAKGSDGVTAVVKQTQGSIGYAELSYAKGSAIPTASIKNGAGMFVQPSSNGATLALQSTTVNPDGTATINYNSTTPNAYPISTFTWVLVPVKSTSSSAGTLLRDFVTYAVTGGQSAAASLFYAPLPASVANQSKQAAAGIS